MNQKIDRFEIRERIGRGGMGTVYKAWDPLVHRIVAIKQISSDVEVTDELRTRFFDEARKLAALTHPNVVTLYEMGEDDGQLFIVMEYLDGEELKVLISKRRDIPLEDKVAIISQLCDGLHFAHQKEIYHRDIKPGNVFVLRNGMVKLIDFGIAKMAGASSATRTGMLVGTPRYMAPEQLQGISNAKSDQYSLGAVCYELLTLRPPFIGESLGHLFEQLRTEEPPRLLDLDPTLPRELAAIVERAMRKDPEGRYADLGRMRRDLQGLRRRLEENVEKLRDRIRPRFLQLRELQTTLRQFDSTIEEDTLPDLDDVTGASILEALEDKVAGDVDALVARLDDVRSVESSVREANELLEREQFSEAAAAFERVLEKAPGFVAAREGLDRVRALLESERRRRATGKLLTDALEAFTREDYAACVGILAEAPKIPAPADSQGEIERLRSAALAAQEAVERARREASSERERLSEIRRRAQAEGSPMRAPALWEGAEKLAADGDRAIAAANYEEALRFLEAAGRAYERFEEEARAASLRERAEAVQRRDEMGGLRSRSRESGAPHYVEKLWGSAESTANDANASLARSEYAEAIASFKIACTLYEQAREAAEKARQEEQQQALRARAAVAEAAKAASLAGAEKGAPAVWGNAALTASQAEKEFGVGRHGAAIDAFAAAQRLYVEAERQAREAERIRIEQAAKQAREAERVRIELAEKQAREAERARIEEAERQAREAENARIELARKQAREAERARIEQAEKQAREAERVRIEQAEKQAREAERVRIEQAAKQAREAERERIEQAAKQAREAERARIEQAEKQAREAERTRIEQAEKKAREAERARIEQTEMQAREVERTRIEQAEKKAHEAERERIEQTEKQAREAERARIEQAEKKAREAERIRIEKAGKQAREAERSKAVLAEKLAREAEKARGAQAEKHQREADSSRIARAAAAAATVGNSPAPTGGSQASRASLAAATAGNAAGVGPDDETLQISPPSSSLAGPGPGFRWRETILVAGGLAVLGLGVVVYQQHAARPANPPREPGIVDERSPVPQPDPAQASAESGREKMMAARHEAETSGAAQVAADMFNFAVNSQTKAETALARKDYGTALRGFDDARSGYADAVVVAEQRQKTLAASARDETARVRHGAEQVDAARYASKRFATAMDDEAKAATAFAASLFADAARLFANARDDYDGAATEARAAKANADGAAAAEAKVAEAKAAEAKAAAAAASAAEAKKEKESREADAARQKHDADLAKSRHDEDLAKKKHDADLAKIQHDADLAKKKGEEEAARARAEAALPVEPVEPIEKDEADTARQLMLADKREADIRVAAATQANTEEANGNANYSRRKYRQAAAAYRTARDLYHSAKRPAGEPPGHVVTPAF